MAEIKPILLVEDSENDIELTLEALAELQLANPVVVLRDGAEAVDYLWRQGKHADRHEGQPIVVLLDLKLPKVNGLEVLQRIKADPHLNSLPVVVLTSSHEESDLVASYKHGTNAYVVKPVDFRQFVDSIKQLGCFWAVINATPRSAGGA